jgi:hypothetical protein
MKAPAGTAQGLELGGEELRHLAAGDDARLLGKRDAHGVGIRSGKRRHLRVLATAGVDRRQVTVADVIAVHVADQQHVHLAEPRVVGTGHRAPGIVEDPGAGRILEQQGTVEAAELAVVAAERGHPDDIGRRHGDGQQQRQGDGYPTGPAAGDDKTFSG